MFDSLRRRFDAADIRISGWMSRYGTVILRYALAIVFIWFGLLKPLGLSPAENLVRQTVTWFPPDLFVSVLGYWEALIGFLFLFKRTIRIALLLLFLQIPGTMLPLFILPEACYTHIPYGLTLEGQYIVKNLVLIGSALVVGGTVRKRNSMASRE